MGPHTAPIALRVADVEAARAELEEKGVVFHGETFDTGVCHMAHFSDPDGNVLMLHRRYAPGDRRRARRLRPRSGDGHGRGNHFYGELLGLERNPNSPATTGSSTRPATSRSPS